MNANVEEPTENNSFFIDDYKKFKKLIEEAIKYELYSFSLVKRYDNLYLFKYKNCIIYCETQKSKICNIVISITRKPNTIVVADYPLYNCLPELKDDEWITLWENGKWIYFNSNNIFNDLFIQPFCETLHSKITYFNNSNKNIDIQKEEMLLDYEYFTLYYPKHIDKI